MRILLLACALPLLAQPNDNRLAVTSDAEIKVAPDRVVISVGVESRNPSLPLAKSRNDQTIAAILQATAAESVAPSTSKPTSSKSTPSTRIAAPPKAAKAT